MARGAVTRTTRGEGAQVPSAEPQVGSQGSRAEVMVRERLGTGSQDRLGEVFMVGKGIHNLLMSSYNQGGNI